MKQTVIQGLAVSTDGETFELSPADKGRFERLSLDVVGAHQLFEFLRDAFEGDLNQRRCLRVPVFAFSGLSVEIHCPHGIIPAEARNISYTGIYFELKADDDPGLPRESKIGVQLTFEDNVETLTGVIKRKFGHGYGVFFPSCLDEENVAPPPLLVSIVAAMQRRAVNFRNF